MSDVKREFDEDFGAVETMRNADAPHVRKALDAITSDAIAAQSIGEQIADEFCRDKAYLTNAEQRRLASMIDARINH